MFYFLIFGTVDFVLFAYFYATFNQHTNWAPYFVLLGALTLLTFINYGVDKGLSKIGRVRIPELLLNVLTALGGFLGAWMGMGLFNHKTNSKQHRTMWIVLVVSTLVHALFIYRYIAS